MKIQQNSKYALIHPHKSGIGICVFLHSEPVSFVALIGKLSFTEQRKKEAVSFIVVFGAALHNSTTPPSIIPQTQRY